VGLPKLFEETVALLGNRARSENKSIILDLAPDLVTMDADPNQLEQVFLNLVNNALDAVEENGTVIVRARMEADMVVIEVIDNGIGIPEQNLKKIFDPFFTTKPLGKGTGLGLAICFGIVQGMDGTITVKSKLRAGTTFTVRLPSGKRKQV
jgi:two-component system NtrC family sensor kinase